MAVGHWHWLIKAEPELGATVPAGHGAQYVVLKLYVPAEHREQTVAPLPLATDPGAQGRQLAVPSSWCVPGSHLS